MELKEFRQKRMADAAKKHGVNALIASHSANIAYITGGYHSIGPDVLNAAQIYALYEPDKGRVAYIASVAEIPSILEHDPGAEIYCFGGFQFAATEDAFADQVLKLRDNRYTSAEEALAAAMKSVSGTVALDESRVNFVIYQKLLAAVGGKKIIPGIPVFNVARMIKHPDEIAAIERSAECAEQCLYSALQCFEPGMSEYDIQRKYMAEAGKRGAIPFFIVATAAKRAAFSDTINTPLVVEKGDMIRFDFGVVLEGYPSDLARTAVFGKPSDEIVSGYEAVRAGTKNAIAAMKPGVAASRIFEIAVEETRKNGLPDYQRHHCGHGIGLETYDLPSIAPSCDIALEENMTLCIETPYYKLGWGGLQIEQTVAVTKDGARYLDKTGDELIVL